MTNTLVGDLSGTHERAKMLAKHSHLDLQSCLAIVVLHELGELGHTDEALTEAFDESMKVHGTAVKNKRQRMLMDVSRYLT